MAKTFMKIKKGVSLSDLPSPPSDPQNGDFYYSDSSGLQIRHNGVWQNAGSGSGIGTVVVDLLDTSLATLPATDATTIDGNTLVVGDLVLFLGLTVGANLAYQVTDITAGNITWSAAYPAFSTGSAPLIGDAVFIERGSAYSLYSFTYDGTLWEWDGINRQNEAIGQPADIPNSSLGFRTNVWSRAFTAETASDASLLDLDSTGAAATSAGIDLSYAGVGSGIDITATNAAGTGLSIGSIGFGIDLLTTALGLNIDSAAGGAVIKANAGTALEVVAKNIASPNIVKWQVQSAGGGSITHKLAADAAVDYSLEWPKTAPGDDTVLTHTSSDVAVWRKPNTGDSALAWTEGGTLTVTDDGGSPNLAWDATAYIQVPGLPKASNEIDPGNFTLATDEVAYVTINRTVTPSTLTVSTALISAITHGNDTFIVAREENGAIVFSSNRIGVGQAAVPGSPPNEFTTVELDNLTTTYAASSGEQILANTSTDPLTIDLPASPVAGDRIRLIDAGAGFGSFNANSVTVNGNGNTIQGQANVVISGDGQNIELVYSSLSDWRVF